MRCRMKCSFVVGNDWNTDDTDKTDNHRASLLPDVLRIGENPRNPGGFVLHCDRERYQDDSILDG